jgi:hypothetical protein
MGLTCEKMNGLLILTCDEDEEVVAVPVRGVGMGNRPEAPARG